MLHSKIFDNHIESDYSDYMITNLREAKASLSHLVQRAAGGEEILITVRGKPKARLIGLKPALEKIMSREEWATELIAEAEAARSGEAVSTPQEYWDEVRSDRF